MKRTKRLFQLLMQHKILLVIMTLISVLLLYSYLTEGILYTLSSFDAATLQSILTSSGEYTLPLFILIIVLEVVIAPLHPSVLYPVGGLIFGGFWAGTWILVANLIGATIAFYIGRFYGQRVIALIDKKHRIAFDTFTKRYGGVATFIIRLNPVTSTDGVNYIAGASKVTYLQFAVGTTLGLVPWAYASTYLGEELLGINPIWTFLFIWWGFMYMTFFIYSVIYAYRVHKKKQLSN